MEITKYRMFNEDGSWVETLNLEEAQNHGNYILVQEWIQELEDTI
jgi:hypothetical protein